MEENQVPNPEQFNVSENNPKKKKGLGPVKGILLAILIVFLICVVGLLIRMVVAGDGDYFKPIKDIFGIEGEKEEKKVANIASSKKSSFKSAERYQLLSNDVEGEDVKHYRLTIDMKDFFSTIMDEADLFGDADNYFDEEYTFDEDTLVTDFDEDLLASEFDELEDEESYNIYGDYNQLEDIMGTAMMMVGQVVDLIDGEMYFDVYFEGNELVQVVIGYDYGKFLENMYDYMLELDKESLEDKGINSIDDLADMMVEEFEAILDKDMLYEMIMEYADEDVEAKLKEFGIKEKDIKDAVDFNVDRGIFEMYINGTTKLKGLLSVALDSSEFQDGLKDMEEETGVKLDEDNVIESILKAANKSEDYADFGFEFIEVK